MKLAGLVRTTLLDFPGKLACVVFTAGCPFNCFYCHNRIALNGDAVGPNEARVLDFISKRVGLLEGVVVSGGEPTIQSDLVPFLKRIKAFGYAVKLDTCGCRPQKVMELLDLRLVDYLALDVKAPWRRYREICGPNADADAVQATLDILVASEIGWECRTTVAPTLGAIDMLEIAMQMPTVPAWRLNVYRIPEVYLPEDEVRVHAYAPSEQDIKSWLPRLREKQPHVIGSW